MTALLSLVTGVLRAKSAAHPSPWPSRSPLCGSMPPGTAALSIVPGCGASHGGITDAVHDLLEQVRKALTRNGIEMTYNHLNVHLMGRRGARKAVSDNVEVGPFKPNFIRRLLVIGHLILASFPPAGLVCRTALVLHMMRPSIKAGRVDKGLTRPLCSVVAQVSGALCK